jgi:chromosome segregation protein
MALTLKRLEMHGFKSFAKRAVLEFNAPVTAIVGPNGSGKSNVVEAIRFVLGEQSSKSLRSKSGADLIFKGSRLVSKMNRASVAMVFDNTKRLFQLPTLSGALSLDFDEITISREVFADGTNEYAINGSSVRLKDIHELISSVHIGSSGHHIISQGEADRLLNAKPVERREILEEALGLRLYHYRIVESSKKLDKTREHVKEIELLRRELAPHIKFLKKQVERVEQAVAMRNELGELYKTYLVTEESIVTSAMNRFGTEIQGLHSRKNDITINLEKFTKADSSRLLELQQSLSEIHGKRKQLEQQDSEITRSLGRIEGTLQALERVVPKVQEAHIDPNVIISLFPDIKKGIQESLQMSTVEDIHIRLQQVHERIVNIEQGMNSNSQKVQENDTLVELQKLQQDQNALEIKSVQIQKEIEKLASHVIEIEHAITQEQNSLREFDKNRFEQETNLHEIEHKLQLVERDRESMSHRFVLLDQEYRIAENFVGDAVLGLQGSGSFDAGEMSSSEHESRKLTIDRLKIRLEDMGGGGSGDILKEYDETTERDKYLEQQLQDLERSMQDLEKVITELKGSLTTEFYKGIHLINSVFKTFFITMFGGGSAELKLVDIIPKKRKGDEEDIMIDEDAPKEQGVDIDVDLPRKKVKDLEMLSGGERSLTSIALLFALSQVNPPPFLVLDETDAALDEANSKKYGDMIEQLAKETQLIVVTHNRETMSRASILYGITLGSDDSSTLLSINFIEAVKVAK